MRKSLKLIVVVSFVAFGIVVFVSGFADQYPAAAQKAARSTTKDIYIRNCARCHGINGRGQTDLGRKYDVPDLVVDAKQAGSAKLVRTIANGKLDMPAFGKKLTKKQIAALAAYVKKL